MAVGALHSIPIRFLLAAEKPSMEHLIALNTKIYSDVLNQDRSMYKQYAEQLSQLANAHGAQAECRVPLAVGFYNLARLSNRFKFILAALEFKNEGIEKIQWNLQMLALASAKSNHQESYLQACKLIELLLYQIAQLQQNLQNELKMFAKQIAELINRSKKNSVSSAKTLDQLQLSRKFTTDCPYISKAFHIADIMVLSPIDPSYYKQKSQTNPERLFFYYVLYLSIACFTRATEKFYCRQSSDKDFHFKAIEIACYLYSEKSTYIKFLKRTYKQHYLEHLESIEEADDNYYDQKVRLPADPEQVPLSTLPWQDQLADP